MAPPDIDPGDHAAAEAGNLKDSGNSFCGLDGFDDIALSVDNEPGVAKVAGSVFKAPASPQTLHAAAAFSGGGAGRGDAVTRALAAQRRKLVASNTVSLKLPSQMPPPIPAAKEGVVDGYRITPVIECQAQVNGLLMQKRNKMRVADVRAAIGEQAAAAEKQTKDVDMAVGLGVAGVKRLQRALVDKAESVIDCLRQFDLDGSGTVSKQEFGKALPLLNTVGATQEDMDELFELYDSDGSGFIEYAELRIARRLAISACRSKDATTREDASPGELDIALQDRERSRQLKELLFVREVSAIAAFEKDKEVKAFVARGSALLPKTVVQRTAVAREQVAAERALSERQEARTRETAELSGERVQLSQSAAAFAAAATPTFDKYANDAFGVRQEALGLFQQGMRATVVRERVARRLEALQASLKRANVSLSNWKAVRQLVVARSRSTGSDTVGKAQGDASVPFAEQQCGPPPQLELTLEGITPFVFPSETDAAASRKPPMVLTPLLPLEEIKCFALRVPRRYQQMGYAGEPLTLPGAFPSLTQDTPLRVGAPFEEGSQLPTGDPASFPGTPLPRPLLVTGWPTQPAPLATGAVAVTWAPEGPAEGVSQCTGLVQPLARPPMRNETCVELQFRAQVQPANETWLHEPVGLCATRSFLLEPTIGSRWRATRRPWAEASKLLPRPCSGVSSRDMATELSEDESDTEVDIDPPCDARLRQIFRINGAVGGLAAEGGEGGEVGEADESNSQPTVGGTEAVASTEASGVAPEHMMELDQDSECAFRNSALQVHITSARRQWRGRLLRSMVALNGFIDQPHYQLSCRI